MREVVPGVIQLSGVVPHAINAYLVGDVLVDARTPPSASGLLRQLRGRTVRTHVVTHGHPDHFGASHAVCEKLGIELWAGEADVAAIEHGRPQLPPGRISALMLRGPMPAGHPVARALREGDQVGDFTVLETPGHSAGHIALWRESDRTLIAGDVFFNLPSLRPSPALLTIDPERNRASMRRLADLRPAMTLFGHGRPSADPDALARVAAAATSR